MTDKPRKRGAPLGNNNAAKNKPWAHEIEKFAAQNPDKKRRIIEKLFTKAEGGDLAAAKEIMDRTEGKTPQAMDITASMSFDGIPTDDLLDLFYQLQQALNADTSAD